MLSGHCPAVSFEVDGKKVRADQGTDYRKGECRDLRNGRHVDVSGVTQADGAVLATSIDVKK
jgi:hypothetical protein